METNNKIQYKLLGYFEDNKRYKNSFKFVLPLFGFEDKIFYQKKSEEPMAGRKITAFQEVECKKYTSIENGNLFKIGDDFVSIFIYDKKSYVGNRQELLPKLNELVNLSDKEFSPTWKYDIGCFIENLEIIEKSIEGINIVYKAKFTIDNFWIPKGLKS